MLIALKQFTRGLRNEDDFFFTTFGPTGSVTTEFVPTYDQVYGHLSVVKPGGPSSLYDSVYTAADRLRGRRNLKKALLIVSDGQDDNSRVSYKKFAIGWENSMYRSTPLGLPVRRRTSRLVTAGEDLTRQTGRRSFLPTPEASMGQAVLAEMARTSGGTSYFPESENEPELGAICNQIALELREQYTIGFYPAGQSTNRVWHRIQVRVNGVQKSKLVLSYRQGYRAVG